MTLLAATTEGVYCADDSGFEDAEQVVSDGHAYVVDAASDGTAFAATTAGLYRSADGGRTWTDCELPTEKAAAVLATDGRVYAGSRPARVYVSADGGASWRDLDGLRDVASFDRWEHAAGGPAQIRSVAVSPDDAAELLVGVESAGAYRSDDGGETWHSVRAGLHDDVHHVLALGDGVYLAATGDGLYRTGDSGETWVRRDTSRDLFGYSYGRESVVHDGRVLAALSASPPLWRDATEAVVLTSEDGGRTFERAPAPGDSTEFVVSWTTAGGRALAGTNEGTVLARSDGEWDALGSVPVTDRARRAFGVTSLAVV